MLIRRATPIDAIDILTWRNDEITRAMSKNGALVETAAHVAWFGKAIEDPARLLLIGEAAGRKIGMVRFDLTDDAWLANINIAPDSRGRGLGSKLLLESIGFLHHEKGAAKILAEVNEDNLPSLRVFEKCGFSVDDRHGRQLYLSRIPDKISTTRSTSCAMPGNKGNNRVSR
jgi:ribosomal protein S18 acetylase RimI-like enzyme